MRLEDIFWAFVTLLMIAGICVTMMHHAIVNDDPVVQKMTQEALELARK